MHYTRPKTSREGPSWLYRQQMLCDMKGTRNFGARLRECRDQGRPLAYSCNHCCQQGIGVCRKTRSQVSLEICTCVSRLHAKENFSFLPRFLPGRLPCRWVLCHCGDSNNYQEVWKHIKKEKQRAPFALKVKTGAVWERPAVSMSTYSPLGSWGCLHRRGFIPSSCFLLEVRPRKPLFKQQLFTFLL